MSNESVESEKIFNKKSNEMDMVRPKRRLNVFMGIYNKCRLEKNGDKDFCLYLANLYQSVKGF